MTATATATTTRLFTIDPVHSEVVFQVRHLLTKVRGRFSDFSGTVAFDEKQPERSSVEFSVRTTSIDTNQADRDTHLRSDDFFSVERFPTLTFVSTTVAAKGTGLYDVTGDLTIRGVTRSVTLPVGPSGRSTPIMTASCPSTNFVRSRRDRAGRLRALVRFQQRGLLVPLRWGDGHVAGDQRAIEVGNREPAGEQAILDEITRESSILSGYDPASEFSRWMRSPAVSTRPGFLEHQAASRSRERHPSDSGLAIPRVLGFVEGAAVDRNNAGRCSRGCRRPTLPHGRVPAIGCGPPERSW